MKFILLGLLNYDYIINLYKLIAVDLSRQKELDADPKSIKEEKYVRQLEKLDSNFNAADAGNDQHIFVLKI